LDQTEKATTTRDVLLLRMQPTLKKRILELAEEKGISANALILTVLNDWLDRYGAPRFKHFNIYQDHITIYDNNIGGLVDVYKRGKKLICKLDGTNKCDHVRFCHTLKEVQALIEKGQLQKP
jgi:hypothetical protein